MYGGPNKMILMSTGIGWGLRPVVENPKYSPGSSIFTERVLMTRLRASQAKELYTLIDENPGIRERIDLSARDLPTASGMLANFFGFFDRLTRLDRYKTVDTAGSGDLPKFGS